MQGDEWVERYVHEVGRQVPAAMRAEAEADTRREVEAALLAAGIEDPAAADEAAVLPVLQQAGRPAARAAHYAPQYLVGPELYPVFRTVLGIVMLVMVGLSIFGASVAVGIHGAPFRFWVILGDLAGGMLQTLGLVVLVFGLIEYFSRHRQGTDAAPWDPQQLPQADALDQVKRGSVIADIVFTLMALILFNLLLVNDGAVAFYNDGWRMMPFATNAFLAFVPWFTVLWVGEIVLKTFVLVRGRWDLATRVIEAALSVAGIVLLTRMLATPALAASATYDPLFKLALAVVVAVATIDVIMQGLRIYGQYLRLHHGHRPQVGSAV